MDEDSLMQHAMQVVENHRRQAHRQTPSDVTEVDVLDSALRKFKRRTKRWRTVLQKNLHSFFQSLEGCSVETQLRGQQELLRHCPHFMSTRGRMNECFRLVKNSIDNDLAGRLIPEHAGCVQCANMAFFVSGVWHRTLLSAFDLVDGAYPMTYLLKDFVPNVQRNLENIPEEESDDGLFEDGELFDQHDNEVVLPTVVVYSDNDEEEDEDYVDEDSDDDGTGSQTTTATTTNTANTDSDDGDGR